MLLTVITLPTIRFGFQTKLFNLNTPIPSELFHKLPDCENPHSYFRYVLRTICDRVININVLSVKETLSMTHVQIHIPSLTRMCVFFYV